MRKLVQVLAIFLAGILLEARALAATIDAATQTLINNKLHQYEDNLQERAQRLLGRQLDDGVFIIEVKAELNDTAIQQAIGADSKNKKIQMLTLPREILPEDRARLFAEQLTLEGMGTFVKNIKVNLSFDTSIDQGQQKVFEGLITNALNLNAKRGDKLTVTRTKLSAKTSSQLNDLKGAFETARTESQRLQGEKQTLTTEKVGLSQKIDDLQKEIESLKATNKSLEEDLSIYKTPMGDIKKIIKGLELPITMIPIALVVMFFLFVIMNISMRAQNARARQLFEGVQVIGTALSKIGVRPGAGGGATIDASAKATEALLARAAAPSANSPEMSSESFDQIRAEALELWKELMDQSQSYLTIAYLKDWLQNPREAMKFASLTEAIGVSESVKLFSLIPKSELNELRKLRTNGSRGQGYNAIFELARMVQADATERPKWFFQTTFDVLNKLSDEELIRAVQNLSREGTAMALFVLTPNRVARVIGYAPQLADALGSLKAVTIADEYQRTQYVTELLERAQATLPENLGVVADHLMSVVERGSPETRERILSMVAGDAQLSQVVGRNAVSIADVMRLDEEVLNEMIEGLEPSQIASLYISLPQNLGNRIVGLLPDKQRMSVQSEFERISRKPNLVRKAKVEGQQIQGALVAQAKQMAEQGLIELSRGNIQEAS